MCRGGSVPSGMEPKFPLLPPLNTVSSTRRPSPAAPPPARACEPGGACQRGGNRRWWKTKETYHGGDRKTRRSRGRKKEATGGKTRRIGRNANTSQSDRKGGKAHRPPQKQGNCVPKKPPKRTSPQTAHGFFENTTVQHKNQKRTRYKNPTKNTGPEARQRTTQDPPPQGRTLSVPYMGQASPRRTQKEPLPCG